MINPLSCGDLLSKKMLIKKNNDANSKDLAQKKKFKKKFSGIGEDGMVKPKPPIHKLNKNKLNELEEHFFMDGITAYKASKLVGIDYKTAKSYFNEWAKQITTDEKYETWV